MKEKLEKLKNNAYSPYFNYQVSAIVVTKDGKEFGGVNVENANGTSICAERNAIALAVSNGYRKGEFKTLNIMTSSKNPQTPCFACRQVILEFYEENNVIKCYGTNGKYKAYKVKDLCPYPFDLNSK